MLRSRIGRSFRRGLSYDLPGSTQARLALLALEKMYTSQKRSADTMYHIKLTNHRRANIFLHTVSAGDAVVCGPTWSCETRNMKTQRLDMKSNNVLMPVRLSGNQDQKTAKLG